MLLYCRLAHCRLYKVGLSEKSGCGRLALSLAIVISAVGGVMSFPIPFSVSCMRPLYSQVNLRCDSGFSQILLTLSQPVTLPSAVLDSALLMSWIKLSPHASASSFSLFQLPLGLLQTETVRNLHFVLGKATTWLCVDYFMELSCLSVRTGLNIKEEGLGET